jgi:opacity protein-like surface antigen
VGRGAQINQLRLKESPLRHILLLFLCLFIPSFVFAEASDEIADRKGNKAIIFSFDEFNLSRFNLGIGAKYWLSNRFAVNISIGYTNNANELETPDQLVSLPDGTIIEVNNVNDIKSSQWGFSTGAQWYFPLTDQVSPYLGGQARITRAKQLTTTKSEPPVFSESRITSTFVNYGVDAIFGIEYFFSRSISLAGEYQFGTTWSSGKTVSRFESSSIRSKSSGRSFGVSTSALILSVYF